VWTNTFKKEILNNATAFLAQLLAKRGRNVELAESAVTEERRDRNGKRSTAKLVDLIANSPEDLLSRLDGRTIKPVRWHNGPARASQS